jgi:hypothetical protein
VSTYVPSWADVKASWSAGWKALNDQAVATYDAAIRANPLAYADKVSGFASALADTRQHLDAIAARLPNPPVTEADRKAVADYQAMEKRYHELAAGFYADAVPADQAGAAVPVIGVAPIVVVAGVAIGVVAIAWAIVAYEYAVNLREQTALADRELTARIQASETGRVLPPSTLPPPPPPPSEGAKGVGLWLLGGLALAAGALTVPLLLRK